MTIAMLGGAMAGGDVSVLLGDVMEEETTGAGAFVPVCLVDSSEKRAFWDLDGKHIQEITRTTLSTASARRRRCSYRSRKIGNKKKLHLKWKCASPRITGRGDEGARIMPACACTRILFYELCVWQTNSKSRLASLKERCIP